MAGFPKIFSQATFKQIKKLQKKLFNRLINKTVSIKTLFTFHRYSGKRIQVSNYGLVAPLYTDYGPIVF